MTAPLQATLNKWVNIAAISAYIDGLASNQKRIDEYGWLNGPAPRQAQAITALADAEAAMRPALALAHTAEMRASEVHYDRLYRRDETGGA